MKTLVIHLSDPTTRDLCKLYEGCEELGEIEVVEQPIPQDELIEKIKSADTVIMLGHGSDRGLLDITSIGGKPKYIVNKDIVPYLRGKRNIGIWCYAREFAYDNDLNGFFSSMWISEEEEAFLCGIEGPFEQEYIRDQCSVLAERVKGLITEGADMSTFPDRLRAMDTENNELTKFNYDGLDYIQ